MKKLLQLIFSLWLFQVQGAARIWTDNQGRSLQAEYIASDATTVTLSISGKHHQIPISRFSLADQTYIREQNGPSPATSAPIVTLPPMTQRQIAEHLFRERDRPRLSVMEGQKFQRVNRPEDLPAEDFYVHGIFELIPSKKPFPWPLLQQMPKLVDLSLQSVGLISAKDITHLNALNSPFSIQIEGDATLDSAAVAALPRLPSLKLLTIAANLVAETDLPTLASRCPNVQTFMVKHPGTATQPPQLSDQGLATALPLWKKLERITLNRIPFTAKTAAAISSCQELETLTLENCGPLTVQAFTPLSVLKALKKVRILFDSHLTPTDVQAIQAALKNCLIEHTK